MGLAFGETVLVDPLNACPPSNTVVEGLFFLRRSDAFSWAALQRSAIACSDGGLKPLDPSEDRNHGRDLSIALAYQTCSTAIYPSYAQALPENMDLSRFHAVGFCAIECSKYSKGLWPSGWKRIPIALKRNALPVRRR